MLVSISPFHNAAIAYARVMGVIDACRQSGIEALPWINGFVRDPTRLDTHRTHNMTEFEVEYVNTRKGSETDFFDLCRWVLAVM